MNIGTSRTSANSTANGLSFTYEENQGGRRERAWAKLREISDEICKEHKLSVIAEPEKGMGISHYERDMQNEGKSWKEKLRHKLAKAIMKSFSFEDLGRSTRDLLNIIDQLNAKGVTLVSNKESIDTDTPTGKFMLTVFAALSQLEREQLKLRQHEGIEIAKAQGKYTGRKPIPIDWTKFETLYGEWRAKHITGRDFMRKMGITSNTFYRRVHEYEVSHGITEQTSA